jgi:hypothetical protein
MEQSLQASFFAPSRPYFFRPSLTLRTNNHHTRVVVVTSSSYLLTQIIINVQVTRFHRRNQDGQFALIAWNNLDTGCSFRLINPNVV